MTRYLQDLLYVSKRNKLINPGYVWIALIIFTPLWSCAPEAPNQQKYFAGGVKQAQSDGMYQVFVPAGDFIMGSAADDPMANPDEKPQHTVFLYEFWMDKVEITNSMYYQCISSGNCTYPVSTANDLSTKPEHPIQGVTWQQAWDYCLWVGRRLPTEAEWEKTARGTDARIYPWGNSITDNDLANFDFLSNQVISVGEFPKGASPYGAYDMAGNVWEWVNDWYSEDYYDKSLKRNPTGPESGESRVIRGGAWNTSSSAIRSANRFHAFPSRDDFNGFRCAEGLSD